MPDPPMRPEPQAGATADAACPVCTAPAPRVLPFRYSFKGRYLYGLSCRGCALVFIHPQPSRSEIAELYSEEYFTEHSDTCGAHGPAAYMEMAEGSDEQRARGARRLDSKIVRRSAGRGDYLEVGCGPGFFLAAMRELGWKVSGLEISEFAVDYAQKHLGLEVTRGSIERGIFEAASFDAIFLGDVLEHLPDPLESLRTLREWLRTGGVLVVAVPSTMNLISAKLGLRVYGWRGKYKTLKIPPYHLFEYTPRSLRAVLTAAGLDVLEIEQRAVPLRRMGLRGSRIENIGKVSFQLAAHLTARVLNRWGDRLTAVARKNASPDD